MNLKNKPTFCDANLSLLLKETEFLAIPHSFTRDGVVRAHVSGTTQENWAIFPAALRLPNAYQIGIWPVP